ncbi:hypothetical protein V8F20_005502 [Naviculisporaceae sp. PSN 640]
MAAAVFGVDGCDCERGVSGLGAGLVAADCAAAAVAALATAARARPFTAGGVCVCSCAGGGFVAVLVDVGN